MAYANRPRLEALVVLIVNPAVFAADEARNRAEQTGMYGQHGYQRRVPILANTIYSDKCRSLVGFSGQVDFSRLSRNISIDRLRALTVDERPTVASLSAKRRVTT
jgi:hypothetical protein